MFQNKEKNWRELCNAAIAARDPHELMRIVEQLDAVLEQEQNARQRWHRASRHTGAVSHEKSKVS
jgi:hypothetical protein